MDSVIPVKVLGLTLLELGTLPEYLEGTQAQNLSLSPSIQLHIGFKTTEGTMASKA